MRQGEVFGLTVDRIDFLRRRVVVDALAAHLPAFPPRPDDFVFTTVSGRPARRCDWGDVWHPVVASVGLQRRAEQRFLRSAP